MDEREEAFQRYVEASENYNAAIIESGDQPWHGGNIERRRELYLRRYQRPQPPQGLPPVSLAVIRGEHRRWTPAAAGYEVAA
ncbi:hypothetical protein [Mycobacterium sp. GA-1841]|uniref:hypothetical protein n=1 Tax=Mycobacterium sp. GA-1841 TaxID=1834154 RepID=UPI0009FB6057|nr:hypothetical protein [Mycobacterium sp. GA-1841]